MNKIEFIITVRANKKLVPYSAETIRKNIAHFRRLKYTSAEINQILLDEYFLETEPIYTL